MASRKRKKHFHSLCSEVGPGDGEDPRFDQAIPPQSVVNRKALQLSSQIERELNAIFAGCGDPVLRELMIVDVLPAPTSMRLLVKVQLSPSASGHSLEEIYQRLDQASGWLRTEVPQAIHRKRAPELLYQVLL